MTNIISRSNADSLHRRDVLKLAAFGIAATSMSGWLDVLAAEAAKQKGRSKKSCILLWMAGGPSHIDTFDPKPESPDAGEFKPIETAVKGIRISDQLPLLAKEARKLAIIRGMSTGEGSHERATYLLHTGYRQGQPFAYPGLGAIVSKEIGDPGADIPNFVSVGNVRIGTGPGYLGPQHGALVLQGPDRGIENLQPPGGAGQFADQMRLLDFLDSRFRRTHSLPEPAVTHETVYQKAARLMQSSAAKAFDLAGEDPKTLEEYGNNNFGKGCLLARRLVEAGVSFIEVPFGGWDTHQQNFPKLRNLLGAVDKAMSALLRDLSARGLLDSTLVIWMGEFGRTPKINKNAGRDHYARAWSTVLAGAGVPGGQVIGRTDKLGAVVEDRPVAVPDFLATLCKVLDIDYNKTYLSNRGRPIRIVDKGEKLIEELVSAPGAAPAPPRPRAAGQPRYF